MPIVGSRRPAAAGICYLARIPATRRKSPPSGRFPSQAGGSASVSNPAQTRKKRLHRQEKRNTISDACLTHFFTIPEGGSKMATAKKPAVAAKKPAATKAAPVKAAAKPAVKKADAPKVARKPNAAFMKALTPSAVLAAVVGATPLPRTEVTKKVWEYIKKHKLQNPENKRNIIADEKLKAVFGGKKEVSMFEMTKLISDHLK
jgi:chromatin remodeling complex protein RSC6